MTGDVAPKSATESASEKPPRSKRAVLFTLFAIVLVDICGYTIVLPLLPFYAEHLGATPFMVGSIVSLFAFAQMISGPILGRWSDRIGRKPILIMSQVGTLVSFVVLAEARFLWVVYLARAIDGLTAGNITVAQAYVADVTTREERTRAMGLIGAAFGLGFVIGPSLSAFFAGWSPQAPIWAACVLSASAITGSIVFLKDTHQHRGQTAPSTAPRASFFSVFHDPVLRWPLLGLFSFLVSFSLLVSGIALFSERALTWNGRPFGVREVGWIFTYGGVLGLVIQAFFIGPAIRKASERTIARVAFACIALGFLLIGSSSLVFIFIAGYTFVQCGSSFVRPTLHGLISRSAPPNAQGFIFGVTQTLMSIAQIASPLLSGLLIETGHTTLWAAASGVVAVVGIIIMQLSRPTPRTV